ncbi:protease IV [Mariprofundus micogutta]|uniref:Protease IV n=1 Tax=Mariprofundus micogutta TaxID=1921010 RepID=A0A1L8CMY4_9PROT|nr:signal peptide peptidase SppA [Mariprofundus micogutta]GAV20254.1 protease IV [Mariprofundus micogutta]
MKKFFSTMMTWLDRFRRILVNGIFILLILVYGAAIMSSQTTVPEDAALIINPSGKIVEELELPSPTLLPSGLDVSTPNQTSLHDMVATIRHAASDPRIRMLILKLDQMDATSLPKLQEIRHAIDDFKKTEKMVIAVGPNYSQSQYYLAATADQVFLNPMGVVALSGFAVYRNYFKDLLAKLHVDIQLFRAGEYKAAAEPLIRNSMSDADRRANKQMIDVLWSEYKRDLADMRKIKTERIQGVLDQPSKYLAEHGNSLAELAKAEGLVDTLADHGNIESYISGAMGYASGDYPSIEFRQYMAAVNDDDAPEQKDRVGIITASGMILDGEQPPGTVGGESIRQMLEQARKDPDIKAVVIRVDSPGGSAQASEVIRAEVERLKASGKPVVVSMGSVAASGGYWLAAPADEIWASSSSITGSIGAFGILANAGKGLKKLGIHSDGLGTTSVAAGIRGDRPLPNELNKVMQLSIDFVYQRFLQVVADGRNIPKAKVADLAEGRVWTGKDAYRLGLVDSLGSFDDAVTSAASRAGLEQYSREWIQQPMGLRELLLVKMFGNADSYFSGIFYAMERQLTSLTGVSLPAHSIQHAVKLAEMVGLSDRAPSVFTICNVQVIP